MPFRLEYNNKNEIKIIHLEPPVLAKGFDNKKHATSLFEKGDLYISRFGQHSNPKTTDLHRFDEKDGGELKLHDISINGNFLNFQDLVAKPYKDTFTYSMTLIKNKMQIIPKKFGIESVFIEDVDPFIGKVKAACLKSKKISLKSYGPIKYSNIKYSNIFNPFLKTTGFSDEVEFRLVFNVKNSEKQNYHLLIGKLKGAVQGVLI